MTVAVVLGVGLVQLLLVWTWFPALQVRGVLGGRVVTVGAAAAADVAVLAADDARPSAPLAAVLALSLLAAFVVQLFRRDGREGLTASLTATGTAETMVVLGSLWLALDTVRRGDAVLLVAVLALAAVVLADLLPLAGWLRWTAGAVVALGASLAVAAGSDLGVDVTLTVGAAATVVAGLATLVARRVPVPHPVLPAVLAALLVAPVAYLLARVLVG
ncbi:MAG TPA: hypothetical protein VH857_08335 [Actinomycetes bacterium]|nr:hypothetical protein [Actinomycetes bacterium]